MHINNPPVVTQPENITTTTTTTTRPLPPRVVGRGARSNYTRPELEHFLTILEEVLPIGPDEWDDMTGRHSEVLPERDNDALRRKYNTLHRRRCPTGDPNIPWEVASTKRIKLKIGERASLGVGNEEYELETNSFSGPGILGDPPPQAPTPPRPPPTLVARPTTEDDLVSPLRPRSSRAAAGDDFLAIMKMQMIQDREERKEDRRLKEEAMREARREEQMRREERDEDRRNTERMFEMAVGGMANYFSAAPKTRRARTHPIESEYTMVDNEEEGEEEEEDDDTQCQQEDGLSDLDSFGEVRDKVHLDRKRSAD